MLKSFIFPSENRFWATFIDIWRFFVGHTDTCLPATPKKLWIIKSSSSIHDTQWPTHQAASWPVWPDWAKFRHFGIISKVFGYICKFNCVFGRIMNTFWLNFYAFGQISLLTMAKYWKYNTAIWSHWIIHDKHTHFLCHILKRLFYCLHFLFWFTKNET